MHGVLGNLKDMKEGDEHEWSTSTVQRICIVLKACETKERFMFCS